MKLSAILATKDQQVVTITPGASIESLIKVLNENRIGAVVVSEDGTTISGIVSERDVVQAFAKDLNAHQRPVSEIMTTEVFVAPPEAHVDELMELMTTRRVRHIPVTDDAGLLVGIVSIGDIVKSRLGELETEKAALLGYINSGG